MISSPADASAVRSQLERVLASAHLRSSRRCQLLLTFVVEAALDGTPERIRERTIGIEVFGRSPDYDTNQDSVVRNAAIEVRKRLAQYYLDSGHEDEIRIVLPHGGYVPEFRSPAPPAEAAAAPPRRKSPRWVAAGATAAIASAAFGLWWFAPLRSNELDAFWAPLLKDRAPVVICVGQPSRLYNLTGPRQAEFDEKLGTGPSGIPQPPEVLGNTTLTLREVRPIGSRYLFFGDTLCMVKVVSTLQARNARFSVRGETTTPYQDLRGSPAVLIGGYNNRWTQRLTGNLRFYFVRLTQENRDELRDRQDPNRQPWVIPGEQRSDDAFDDFAIVTRLLDSSTEKPLVAIAGVTHSGTQSAGEFVTSAEHLRSAFRNAPAGWQLKNLQIVLKTRIVTGAAGPPRVVALHVW